MSLLPFDKETGAGWHWKRTTTANRAGSVCRCEILDPFPENLRPKKITLLVPNPTNGEPVPDVEFLTRVMGYDASTMPKTVEEFGEKRLTVEYMGKSDRIPDQVLHR